MTKWRITIAHDACTTHDVEADDEESAIEQAFGLASPCLCYHCSDEIELGDPTEAVIVENLDAGSAEFRGADPAEIASLRAQLEEAQAEAKTQRQYVEMNDELVRALNAKLEAAQADAERSH
jgi:hypothetical protein